MAITPEIRRFGRHSNAFGFLRLLFASLVIVSHTPELADGDRHRELLTRLFGTLSFGEMAVDGFFLISGYLIAGSFLKQPHIWPYLKKRIVRIYPGFAFASLACALVVAPVAGADPHDTTGWLKSVLLLYQPKVPGAFAGTYHPDLNGAIWTIRYEFACYLLVLLLGLAGVLKRPRLVAFLVIVGFTGCGLAAELRHLPGLDHWFGPVEQALRLGSLFVAGSAFFLFDGRIAYRGRRAIGAALALLACLFFAPLAEPAVAVLGGYLIVAVAKLGGRGLLGRINNRDDISYGVYLYGWPLEKLLFLAWPKAPLPLAALATFAGALMCGWLSWHLIEKPAMRLVRGKFSARSEAATAASPETDFVAPASPTIWP